MHLKNTLLAALCLLGFALNAQTSFQTAIEHIQSSGRYSAQDLADVSISDEYQSRHNGITHLYLKQKYEGIEVKGAFMNFNLKSGVISSSGGTFVDQLAEKVNSTSPGISASKALESVIAAHQVSRSIPQVKSQSNQPDNFTVFEKGSLAHEDIEVRLIYVIQENELRLCWEVSLYELSCHNWWISAVDAQSGEILEENNQVIHCSFHEDEVQVRSATNLKQATITLKQNATLVDNSYNVFAYPVESPNHGDRSIQESPWNDAGDAGTLGWHDDGTSTYTHTRGNNVDAYQDQNNSNGPTGGNSARADGGSNLEFDFPLDLNTDPESDPDPYITNLFYWNNIMHDVFYQYGFDEVSGNFQEDNLGRGGSGSDYVRAEAQDGGGTNNANFSTPTDGGNPRMQMYLWSPDTDDELEVNAPGNVAGFYDMRPAAFGGSLNTPITGDVVEVDDGSANSSLGCDPLVNGGALSGKIALVDRGDCQFGTKSLNAQNAGAIAVIVCNNESGLVTMSPGNDGDEVTIPAVMIRQADCTTIRAELNNGLNVTMVTSDNNPPLDGDLDNGIIAHEYGHGISIRLTGGPGTNCLSGSEQMGEGWSDFFGIWLTIEASDNHYDPRGVGTYALGENPGDTGIRNAPYSTDFALNDYTYGDLPNGNISVPHGVGFIWCTMIWDLNWAMINQHDLDMNLYTGNGGNNLTAQLILDGLKGQGCNPGFVDGRDAILQADVDNNGGANRGIIWNVFARRGLGFSADQGSSGSRSDGTEAFDLPQDVTFMTEEELFGAGPLPVELTAFNAISNNEQQMVELYWNTASEVNNRGFDLQRKAGTNSDFESFAWIPGNGTADGFSNYTHQDKDVKSNVDYYYRLHQVDFNEQENFSSIVTARLKGLGGEIQIFPNPSQGISTVQFPDEFVGKVNMEILNAQGQVIGVRLFETDGGAVLEVDLTNQPEGIYFLRFEIGEQVISKRILLNK